MGLKQKQSGMERWPNLQIVVRANTGSVCLQWERKLSMAMVGRQKSRHKLTKLHEQIDCYTRRGLMFPDPPVQVLFQEDPLLTDLVRRQSGQICLSAKSSLLLIEGHLVATQCQHAR